MNHLPAHLNPRKNTLRLFPSQRLKFPMTEVAMMHMLDDYR